MQASEGQPTQPTIITSFLKYEPAADRRIIWTQKEKDVFIMNFIKKIRLQAELNQDFLANHNGKSYFTIFSGRVFYDSEMNRFRFLLPPFCVHCALQNKFAYQKIK